MTIDERKLINNNNTSVIQNLIFRKSRKIERFRSFRCIKF